MFEQFINESEELKLLCETNNISPYHSGGGCYHYELDDEHFPWLFNLSDEYDKRDVPSKSDEICDGGLELWKVTESYFNSINIDYDDCESDIEKHLKSLNIEGLSLEVGNGQLMILQKKFSDIIPIVKKVNKEILKFLDKWIETRLKEDK